VDGASGQPDNNLWWRVAKAEIFLGSSKFYSFYALRTRLPAPTQRAYVQI